mgnify:CR=1 FL=1
MSGTSARTIRIFSLEVSTDLVIHESPAWAPRCSHPERRGRRLTQRPPLFRIDPIQIFMQSHEEGSAAGWDGLHLAVLGRLVMAGLGCCWL